MRISIIFLCKHFNCNQGQVLLEDPAEKEICFSVEQDRFETGTKIDCLILGLQTGYILF